MPMDRFLIASQEVGLQTDVKPFLLPESAYAELANVYIFRERLRKRFGSRYMIPITPPAAAAAQTASRLRMSVGTLGSPISPVPLASGAIGQMFSIANVLFTVNVLGTPMNLLVANGSAATAQFNTSNGTFSFAGVLDSNNVAVPAGTPIYWYPSLPVMGISTYQVGAINDQPTIAFDTRFAYQYGATGWERLAGEATNSGESVWAGSNSQFFWATTFQGVNTSQKYLYVTNFNASEQMRYFDGSVWHFWQPTFTDTDGVTISIKTCRMIVPFKGRLNLMNTVEDNSALGNNLSFVNRSRYSVIGSPIDNAGASYYAFLDDADSANYKGAGFVDNTQTQEAIVSGEFLKDRFEVYYERSVYDYAYQGNEIFPFGWYQINTELGAQSTFSKVPFDREILAIGQSGIHSCSGQNVRRIDDKIPDEVFDIQQENNGVQRVWGIRDYFVEQVYWIFPSIDQVDSTPNNNVFPNRVFVYNYKTGSWAYNSDSFTALGYFTQQSNLTWGTASMTWGDASMTWGSGTNQSNFRQVIAGNQEGYIVIIDSESNRNAGMLQISDITIPGVNQVRLTIIDHNLTATDNLTDSPTVLFIENVMGTGLMTALNNAAFQISQIVDKDTIEITAFPLTGVYAGGGAATRVSNINIRSKQWNPYAKQGKNFTINKMDFLVDKTSDGQVTVDYSPSTSYLSMIEQSVPGVNTGNFVLETSPYPLYPLENTQEQLWHTIYYNVFGTYVQIRIFMSDEQMLNPNISLSPFVLHALVLTLTPTGRLQ